jgi:hypothetical protein
VKRLSDEPGKRRKSEETGREERAGEPPETPANATNAAAICPICGGPLLGIHCKLVCENCGYREDCSDLFPAQ